MEPSDKNEVRRHPFRSFFAFFALALICIGCAELIVCRIEDPALYESITAPAHSVIRGVHDEIQALYTKIDERLEARRAEQERLKAEEERRQAEEQRQAEEREREALRRAEEERLAAQVASAPSIVESIPHADPTITELLNESGSELLTGGNVRLRYFNQTDDAWSSLPFGRDPIGRFGCGPTVLAMAAASLADDSQTPASVAEWAAGAGYCAPGSGSYLSIVSGVSEHFGLECTSLGAIDGDSLYERLSEGGLIVALMGPGHFTGGGHFILLHGVTLTGGVLVADPASRDNSLTVWDPQLIVSELSLSRHDGAPLWLIQTPQQ